MPDVVSTAVGLPETFASPSAMNPADRSSKCTRRSIRPSACAAAKAMATGADLRARAYHRIAHAMTDELIHQNLGEGGRGIHRVTLWPVASWRAWST